MNKLTRALLVSGLVIGSSSVLAQSKFAGGYAQLGVGYSSINASTSGYSLAAPTGATYQLGSSAGTASGFNGVIGAGYNIPVSPTFLVGVGIDWMPFSGSNATGSVSSNSLSPSSQSFTFNQNSLANIYIAPGIATSPDGLLYAKIGYSALQIQTKSNYNGNTGNTNFNGYVLGLGYKQLFSGNWYGFGEITYASYGSQNMGFTGPWIAGGTYAVNGSVSPTSTNAMVGVGYKF